jgi:acetyl esterase/lipase
MIYLLHLFIAINLFAIAFAGAIYFVKLRTMPTISFFYFGWSLVGQIFALPFLIITLGSLYIALFSIQLSLSIVMINLVTLALLSLTLLYSWQGSQVLSQVEAQGRKASIWLFLKGALFPFQLPKRSVKRVKNITYGPHGSKNLLDIYMPKAVPLSPMPVLIHVHGGGWVVGRKHQQAKPLIQYMAAKGWLVVDINYRLGPKNRMPAMIEDVLRAVAWVKTNIQNYNGDPNFVALTGGSAGGHLVSLAALTAKQASLKPGFEYTDCSVNACVPVYGVFDFIKRNTEHNEEIVSFQRFLTKAVMPGPPETHATLWDQVSPMSQVNVNAPPMLILQGRHDALVSVESAKLFAEKLTQTSKNKVTFAELPSGQHAYDIANVPPTPEHIRAVYRFLESVRLQTNASSN